MSTVQEVVTEAPAVEAVPKKAMTLGYGTSLAVLALLIVVDRKSTRLNSSHSS